MKDEPIQARPIGTLARLKRWGWRKPLLAGLVALCLLLVFTLVIGSVSSAVWIAHVNGQTEIQRNLALEKAADLRRHLYAADVRQAQLEWQRGDPDQARTRLAHYLPQPGEEDLRSFAWHYLWHVFNYTPTPRILSGHEGDVFSLAFSPDGKTLASGGKDGKARLWDLASGTARIIDASKLDIDCVVFSPDGRTLATTGDDGVIRLWNTETTERQVELSDQSDEEVVALAFNPDGKILASGGNDQHIRLWDLKTKQVLAKSPKHRRRIEGLTFSNDGANLISVGGDVLLWNVADLSAPVHHFGDDCSAVALLNKARKVVYYTNRSSLLLVDLDSFTPVVAWPGMTNQVQSFAVSPDDRILASTGEDGKVQFWDLSHSANFLAAYDIRGVSPWCVKFSPDGRTMAVGAASGGIRLFDVKHHYPLPQWHSQEISQFFALSSDGSLVASLLTKSHTLAISQTVTGQLRHRLSIGAGTLYVVSFSLDGRKILCGFDDGLAEIWDLNTGTRVAEHANPFGGISQIDWDPEGRYVYIMSGNVSRIWESESGRLAFELADTRSGRFSPDGKTLAIVMAGKVHLYDAHSGTRLSTLDQCGKEPCSLAFSPDGKNLAVGNMLGGVVVCDLATGQPTGAFTAQNRVQQVLFSRDGTTIVTMGASDEIQLWDVRTWRQLATLQGGNRIAALAFAPDDRELISVHYTNEPGFCIWRWAVGNAHD